MLDGSSHKTPFRYEEAAAPREAWRDGVDLRVLASKLGARRRLLIRSAAAGALALGLAAAGWVLLRPTVYAASSEILITNTTLQLSGQDAVVTQLLVENTLLQSQMLLARSSAVMERAIERLGAARVEALLPQPGPVGRLLKRMSPTAADGGDGARRALIRRMQESVAVTRVGASQIIALRARGDDAEAAALLANEATSAYLAELRDINAVVTTSGAFRERIGVLGPTARVVARATPPLSKDGPRGLLVLAAAPLLGGLLGLGAAAALALLDRRVWSPRQLAAITGAEVFGRVESRDGASWMEALGRPSGLAVALRRLRAAALERRGGRPRVLAATSLGARNGGTTAAVGLALLVAGEGRRVLLIDASSDRSLSRSLAPGDGPGLRDVLNDAAVLPRALRLGLRENLDFLPAGRGDSDIDTRWPDLLAALGSGGARPYDWLVLDCSPLDQPLDVRAVAAMIDDLVIVVGAGLASGAVLAQELESLGPAREKLLGSILQENGGRAGLLRPTPKPAAAAADALARRPMESPTKEAA